MKNIKVKIHHLYHSGVSVDFSDYFLVFDYYKDISSGHRDISNGVLGTKNFNNKKKNFVFVTHSHSDHFNPVIFDWNQNNNIKYILSSDVDKHYSNDNTYYLKKYQELNIDNLNITTYGTTDQGLSYFIKVDNFNIFHAGDLNWWHWENFTEEEQKREEDDFKREINKLEGKKIDVAFIPVDPRLGEHYYLAGEYVARTLNPEMIIPIHFANDFQVTENFADKISDLPVKVATINHRGAEIVYEK